MGRVGLVGVLAIGACGSNSAPPPPAPAHEAPVVARPAAPPVDVAPTRTRTEARTAVVSFMGEDVQSCYGIELAKEQDPEVPTLLALDRVSLIAYQDARSSFDSGDGVLADLAKGKGGAGVTFDAAVGFYARMAFDAGELTPDGRKQLEATADKAAWPFPDDKAAVERGELALVKDCKVPNHVPLGTCAFEGRYNSAHARLEARVARYNFDVASTVDSDAAYRTCLRLRGNYTAATGAEASFERARQHAAVFRR